MRFIHLTDLHFSAPGAEDPYLSTDTPARLERAAELIARVEPEPAFVAITGDLTNRGDPESYALLAEALDRFEVPLLLALGNHDDRAAFRAQFEPGAAEPEAPVFHHARHGELHVIALDSLVPGRVGGAVGAAQLEMLDAALSEHPGCRKLILCHHPPHTDRPGALPWESLSAEDTAGLARVLAGHEIAGMLCGHVHADRVLQWQGFPVVVSTGLHNAITPLEAHDTVFEDGAGFAICDHLAGGLEVTFVPVVPERAELGRIDRETVLTFR